MVTKMMKVWFAIKGCIVDWQFQCEVVSTVTEGGVGCPGVRWVPFTSGWVSLVRTVPVLGSTWRSFNSVEDTLLALVSCSGFGFPGIKSYAGLVEILPQGIVFHKVLMVYSLY